jgi:hypothetical protein
MRKYAALVAVMVSGMESSSFSLAGNWWADQMMKNTLRTIKTLTAACAVILFLIGRVQADTWDILAANLKQDTLQQGSSEEKFHLLQQLIANDEFKDFNKASTTTVGGGGSYVDMVDAFLNVTSTSSSWEQDRSSFCRLLMTRLPQRVHFL